MSGVDTFCSDPHTTFSSQTTPQVIFHFFQMNCDSLGLEPNPGEHFPVCGPLKATTASLDVDRLFPHALLILFQSHFYAISGLHRFVYGLGCFALCSRVSIQIPTSDGAAPVPSGNSAADVACVGLKKRRLLILLIESLL